MTDLVLGWAQELMTSPWIYVVVWVIATLDGFFPVVPSESLVITAGVFAAQGDPDLAALIAVAAAGAFVGDHTSYLLGHAARSRLDGLHAGSRRQRGLVWARRVLRRRGGLVLVVARYVPGGRTAITLTMGATRYPMTRFTPLAALAAVTWATYSALVGLIGGHTFEEDPLKGVLLGIGLAVTVTAVVEYIRYRHRRLSPARSTDPATPSSLPTHDTTETCEGAVRP